MSDIPTPRTDAATHDDWCGGSAAVELEVAQQLERELAVMTEQVAEWKQRFIAFAIVHCAEFGRQHYGENCLHFTHYDLLQEAGARLVAFKRCGEVLP